MILLQLCTLSCPQGWDTGLVWYSFLTVCISPDIISTVNRMSSITKGKWCYFCFSLSVVSPWAADVRSLKVSQPCFKHCLIFHIFSKKPWLMQRGKHSHLMPSMRCIKQKTLTWLSKPWHAAQLSYIAFK